MFCCPHFTLDDRRLAHLHQLLIQCVGTSLLRHCPLQALTGFDLDLFQPSLQLLKVPNCLFELGRNRLNLLPCAVDISVRTIFDSANVALLVDALLLGLEPQRL